MNSWSVQQFFCLFLLLLTISNHTDGEVFFFYWHLLRQDDKYKRKKNFTQIMQNVYRVSATEWSRLEWATPKRTPSCRQAGGSNCGVKSGGGETGPCGKWKDGGLATDWKFLGVKVFKSAAILRKTFFLLHHCNCLLLLLLVLRPQFHSTFNIFALDDFVWSTLDKESRREARGPHSVWVQASRSMAS